jgi:hypothetical protein
MVRVRKSCYPGGVRPAFDRVGEIPIVGPIFEGAGDVLTSILDRLPGSKWVKDAVNAGAGWIGDFAKTPLGFWTLQVITNNLYGPLASQTGTYGPQIASVVWAVPGLAKGDSFSEAYVTEWVNRAVGVAQFFAGKGVGDVVAQLGGQVTGLLANPDFKQLFDQFKAQFPGQVTRQLLVQAHLTPEEISKKFNVRPDAAATAINAQLKTKLYNVGAPQEGLSEFDANGIPFHPTTATVLVPIIVPPKNPFKPVTKLNVIVPFPVLANPPASFSVDGARVAVSATPAQGVFRSFLQLALLTAPAWVPAFVFPRLRK